MTSSKYKSTMEKINESRKLFQRQALVGILDTVQFFKALSEMKGQSPCGIHFLHTDWDQIHSWCKLVELQQSKVGLGSVSV